MGIALDFEWPVAATYKIAESEEDLGGDDFEPPQLLISTAHPKLKRPTPAQLRAGVGLMLDFRWGVNDQRHALAIAKSLGQLEGWSEKWHGEVLDKWLLLSKRIQAVYLKTSTDFVKEFIPPNGLIGKVDLTFRAGPNGKPNICLRPHSLADALLLRAAELRADGVDFRRCEHCNAPLINKIASARFCCDECRTAFNNERRKR